MEKSCVSREAMNGSEAKHFSFAFLSLSFHLLTPRITNECNSKKRGETQKKQNGMLY